jgi:hypothetical protein
VTEIDVKTVVKNEALSQKVGAHRLCINRALIHL